MQVSVVSTEEESVVTATGLYYEDMAIGQLFLTQQRRVSEFDILAFARLTGDTNPIHLDSRAAAESAFGKRIAHGALVLSVATGLAYGIGLVKGTVIFESIKMDFKRPVFIDDRISLRLQVSALEPARRPANTGKVTLHASILNQDDKVVQAGTWNALVSRRPSA